MASSQGNQIFVTLKRGKEWPVQVVEVRVKYEQTIADLRAAVAKKAGIDTGKLQLFWHSRELGPERDAATLLDMNLHTGFSLQGYDLSVEPDYWPPVRKGADGRLEVVPADG